MTRCIILRLAKRVSYLGMGMLLLIVVIQVGCKRSTTVVGPDGEKATVTQKNKTTTEVEVNGPMRGKATMTQKGDDMEVTYKREDGKEVHFASGKNVVLPAGFSDVAIYPKATVASLTMTSEGMLVMLKSADSTKKVKAFYEEKLKANGWKIETTLDTPVGIMLQGTKEKRTLNVLVATESDKTSIQLTVTNEKN